MAVVLALDISGKNTGAAFDRDGVSGAPSAMSFGCPPGTLGNRLKPFIKWLYDLAVDVRPDIIAIEAPLIPSPRGKLKTTSDTVRLLVSLAGAAHYVAACVNVKVIEKNNGSIKRFWTQNGKADKRAMMHMCRTLGWVASNDDEADAAALWAMVKAETDPKFSYTTMPLGGRAELERRETAARAGGS